MVGLVKSVTGRSAVRYKYNDNLAATAQAHGHSQIHTLYINCIEHFKRSL